MIFSVETDSDEFDSDDGVKDPHYVLDTIRPDREKTCKCCTNSDDYVVCSKCHLYICVYMCFWDHYNKKPMSKLAFVPLYVIKREHYSLSIWFLFTHKPIRPTWDSKIFLTGGTVKIHQNGKNINVVIFRRSYIEK